MLIIRTVVLYVAVLGAGLFAPMALAKPPAEAFGQPTVRFATISPDGKNIASVWSAKDGEVLVITNIETGKSRALANVSTVKPRGLTFVSSDYVVAVVSQTRRTGWRGEKFQHSTAFAFNLKNGSFVELQRATPGLAMQSGLGRVLGVSPDGAHVYMPAYVQRDNKNPTYALFQVNLATGAAALVNNGWGSTSTIDWIVGPTGDAEMREEFFENSGKHTFMRLNGSTWETVMSEKSDDITVSLVGVRAGDRAPLASAYSDTGVLSLYALDPSSATMMPSLAREDVDIESLVSDASRVVYGVRYSGMTPTYGMFDPALDAAVRKVQKALSGTATYLTDWSADWSKMMFYSEGGTSSGEYFIFNRSTGSLQSLMGVRPAITDDAVADVELFDYKARDGLHIRSLVTWPVDVAADDRKNLPLIVMPHGGPATRDMEAYDWWTQFLAEMGYAVIQPNYRGSTGYGVAFQKKGEGEWGLKMQDDLLDAIGWAAKQGIAHSKRVCIIGASYGGYAAMRGAQRDGAHYRCAISYAGVSDLSAMKRYDLKFLLGKYAKTFWKKQVKDFASVSPRFHADEFATPILVAHGVEDKRVPVKQSRWLADALKKAGKDYQYLEQKEGDHHFSRAQDRLEFLRATQAFLLKHNPPGS